MTQKNALMISAVTPPTRAPNIHLSSSISPFISTKRWSTWAKRWSMFLSSCAKSLAICSKRWSTCAKRWSIFSKRWSTCAKRVFTCAKPSFISASRRANALPFLDSDSARPCKFISSTSAKASASASAWAAGTPAVFSRFANLSVSNATDVTHNPALAPCGGEYSSVPPTHPEVLHGALA
ncbi:phage-related protein [Xylella fastidiosa Temecula1]|uniref:Phage-related protein n=1 Tax=Xylella fastidiosa (strain Temecula1 / ATCC 700964) TaxID=183190 RepID=Q87CE4_XYLFT|nr:phage-related protein [Xylella fastidiosa Temecula1]